MGVEVQAFCSISYHLVWGPPLSFSTFPAECEAAREAGMPAAVVVRPGNEAIEDGRRSKFEVIESFAQLVVPTS